MPENLPLAVVVLVWLLSGIILFGWLMMTATLFDAVLSAVLFFGLPVLVYQLRRVRRRNAGKNGL